MLIEFTLKNSLNGAKIKMMFFAELMNTGDNTLVPIRADEDNRLHLLCMSFYHTVNNFWGVLSSEVGKACLFQRFRTHPSGSSRLRQFEPCYFTWFFTKICNPQLFTMFRRESVVRFVMYGFAAFLCTGFCRGFRIAFLASPVTGLSKVGNSQFFNGFRRVLKSQLRTG